jgi:hypothetical protein
MIVNWLFMVSCYWVQPAQLHPWFKSHSLKRKSSMLLRSESPSPVDEDDPDPDSRVKRQRHTTLTLEHARLKKRKLPSCPQSSAEEEGEDVTDARSLITKRQRYTALEHGFERLSLTPPSYPATQEASMPVPAPEFATHLPDPGVPPNFGFSSSSPQWVVLPTHLLTDIIADKPRPSLCLYNDGSARLACCAPRVYTPRGRRRCDRGRQNAIFVVVRARERPCVRMSSFLRARTDTRMSRDRRHRFIRVVGRRTRRRRRWRAEAAACGAAGAVVRGTRPRRARRCSADVASSGWAAAIAVRAFPTT